MKYFKIKIGFESDEIIEIDETELEKAVYAHMTGAKAIFKNGSVSGANIISVTEDYHRAMGWNRGYKLGVEEFREIKGKLGNTYRDFLADAGMRVKYFISTNQVDLIGTGVEVKALGSGIDGLIGDVAKSKTL